MMIDTIYDIDKTNYTEEYRKEFFDKLFIDTNRYPEYSIVFDNVLLKYYEIIACHNNLLKQFFAYPFKTVIQFKIKKEISKKKPQDLQKGIQSFSVYAFEYFEYLQKKDKDKFTVDRLIEHQFPSF